MSGNGNTHAKEVRRRLHTLRAVTRRIAADRKRKDELVRLLRLDDGVGPTEVARAAGVTPAMIWQILNPKSKDGTRR